MTLANFNELHVNTIICNRYQQDIFGGKRKYSWENEINQLTESLQK